MSSPRAASATCENEIGAISESGHTYSVLPAIAGSRSSGSGMPQLTSRVIERCAQSSSGVLAIPAAASAAAPASASGRFLNCSTRFLPAVYFILCDGRLARSSLYAASRSPATRRAGSTRPSTSLSTDCRQLPVLLSIHTRRVSATLAMSRNQCTVSRITGVASDSALRGLISSLGSCWWPHLSHSSLYADSLSHLGLGHLPRT